LKHPVPHRRASRAPTPCRHFNRHFNRHLKENGFSRRSGKIHYLFVYQGLQNGRASWIGHEPISRRSSPPCADPFKPPLRGPASPLRRDFLKPPLRRRYTAPLCAASPLTRGAAAPLRWTLAPLRVARGWPPRWRPRPRRWPATGGQARWCAALAGAALPRRWRGCGWSSLAGRSLATRACARWRGQSGPREDRRGSSRRSAALFRPAGFGWGRARSYIAVCHLIRTGYPTNDMELSF